MSIVNEVLEDADNDPQSAVVALCDGEYLATKDWTQSQVEGAYNQLLEDIDTCE